MINLSSSLFKNLLAGIETKPEECCGFLFGSSTLDKCEIDMFFHVTNNSEGDKSTQFKISVNDYKQAEDFAFEHGNVMLGIYHSHINHPPIPSELDRKFAFPGFYYLIISLVDLSFSEVKCWKITSQRKFTEIGIKFNS